MSLTIVAAMVGCSDDEGQRAESTVPRTDEAAVASASTTAAQAGEASQTAAVSPSTEPSTETLDRGEARISGSRLESTADSVGRVAPRIEGRDLLTGDTITWGGEGGGPAAILLAPLADWCPHCAAHIEEVLSYVSKNGLPQGVNLLTVTTLENPSAQYPQDRWLAERQWPIPTVADSDDGSLSQWFGIESVPMWVLVGGDGSVVEFVDGHAVDGAALLSKLTALTE